MNGISLAADEVGAVASDGEPQPVRLRRILMGCCAALHRYLAHRVGGDRHVADDLLQQTCFEASRCRRVPDGDDACEAWLHGIAKHLLHRHWRGQRRSRRLLSIDQPHRGRALVEAMESGPLPAEQLVANETLSRLSTAVAMLRQADRQLIFASYFEGRSHADLAMELGVSPKTVETRLYRARRRLRAALREE